MCVSTVLDGETFTFTKTAFIVFTRERSVSLVQSSIEQAGTKFSVYFCYHFILACTNLFQ